MTTTLSHLYTMHAWSRYFRDQQRIYLIYETVRTRQTGGTYKSSTGTEIFEVRGTNSSDKGQSRTNPTNEGISYVSYDKFLIPTTEFDRIGKDPQQPILMVALEPDIVYRVVDKFLLHGKHILKINCERTRDKFPTFSYTWTFEADEVGEDPSGWTPDEPADVQVVTGKYMQLNSGTVSAEVQDVIRAPAISASLKVKVELPSQDEEICSIFLGDELDGDGVTITIERIDGAIEANGVAISAGEWHDISITKDVITIDEEEVASNDFTGNVIALSGKALFDDVEVSCIDAL